MKSDKVSRLLTVPALVIISVCFFVPLAWIAVLSFLPAKSGLGVNFAPPTLDNYVRFFSDSYYVGELLLRTVKLAAIATLFSVLIGYAGALLIVRAKQKYQAILIFLVMCPLWVNLVVRTLSLMVALGRDGPVNKALMALGIIDAPIQLLFNETAVVIGMVQVSVPFVVLSLYGVMQAIPRQLEHAAMTIGATPLQAFRRITLPLSMPGIAAGSVLAFGINMESFVVPILLGGGRVRFMSVAAYETAVISNNLPFAATIGVVLLGVTVAMLLVYQRLLRSLASPAGAPAAATM